MSLRNNVSLLLRHGLSIFDLRLVRLTTNKIRGVDPILDLKSLLQDCRNPLILDVGANDGEVMSGFLVHFPDARVIAFEPFQTCYDELATTFAHRSNVAIEQMALGSSPGTGRLNVFSASRMNSLLEMDDDSRNIMKDSFTKTTDASVAVDTLDSYCLAHGINHIDALKIDTQGYDLEVLKGAEGLLSQHRITAILLEINFIPMYAGQPRFVDIHGFLTSRDYQLVDLYNHTRPRDYIAWCDACYVSAKRQAHVSGECE